MTDLLDEVDALPEKIREHVREQVDDWRQVPYLALQVDGRTGHNAAYSRAYRHGVWEVRGDGSYPLGYVDCATGDLVTTTSVCNGPVATSRIEAGIITDLYQADELYIGELNDHVEQAYGQQGMAALRTLVGRGDVQYDVDWNATLSEDTYTALPDESVLGLVGQLDKVDAAQIVTQLETRAAQPHGSYYDEDEKQAWREERERWTLVEPVYVRRRLDDRVAEWLQLIE